MTVIEQLLANRAQYARSNVARKYETPFYYRREEKVKFSWELRSNEHSTSSKMKLKVTGEWLISA